MRKMRGFTLIELMIVIAIVAILAGIGVPAYQNQVKKSKRSDAQAALLSFAAAMERYYTLNGTYAKAAEGDKNNGTPKSSLFSAYVPINQTSSDDANYELLIANGDADSFIINAKPINSMKGDYIYQYQSTGLKRRGGNGHSWVNSWD